MSEPQMPSMKRDWIAAFGALRKLLANGDDTVQVFVILTSALSMAVIVLSNRLCRSRRN